MQRQNLIDSNFKAYNAGSDKSRRHTIIERNLATKSSKYFGVELVKIDSEKNNSLSFEEIVRITEEPISNTANFLME